MKTVRIDHQELEEEGQLSEEPPPVLKSWKQIYAVVLGNLAFWIVIFALFTWVFQ